VGYLWRKNKISVNSHFEARLKITTVFWGNSPIAEISSYRNAIVVYFWRWWFRKLLTSPLYLPSYSYN
jgi:hypothetical protein